MKPTIDPINVVIADDHPLIIEGLTSALKRFGIKVQGAIRDLAELEGAISQLNPDVLILDIRFGDGETGLEAAKRLLKQFPELKVVFYSQFDQDEILKTSYQIGAKAFINKDSSVEVLADAVRRAHEGGIYLQPDIAERLALINLKSQDNPLERLSEREKDVCKMIAMGKTNEQIAQTLKLSLKTITVINKSIKEKIGMDRAADITRLAAKYGLIKI